MAKQVIIKGTPVVAANEVLVADSNSKIPAVDGSLVTAIKKFTHFLSHNYKENDSINIINKQKGMIVWHI